MRCAHAGQDAGRAPHPRAIRLAERERHAWPHPGAALARVVEQPGEQDLVVGDALLAQRRDHVEAVPPVGDVHRIEQCQLRRAHPGRQRRPLVGGHAGPHVRPELADLATPPGR